MFRLRPIPAEDGVPRFALLDGTRSAFQVSNRVHEVLTGSHDTDLSIPAEIPGEIRRLRDLGFWPEDPVAWELSEQYVSLSLHLIHGCNLACPYCNVQQGTYGEPESLMSMETAFAAVDFLKSMAGNRFPRLVFYGGEPLLNWEVLTRVVRHVSSVLPSCALQVITNGTLLDRERAAFFAENHVFTVLSLDGPREVQDRNRPARDGGGSYERACRGLACLREANAGFHIRGTWVPDTVDYDRVFSHLAELAGDERKVTVALEFGQNGGEGVDAYNETLCRLFRDSARSEGLPPLSLGPFLDQVLRGDHAPISRCEAGHAGFSVTPDGTLYPCQVSAYLKEFPLGTVKGGMDDSGKRNQGAFLGIQSPACHSCWARTLCFGPCPMGPRIESASPYCTTTQLQIGQALQWAARASADQLTGQVTTGEPDRRIERNMALRGLLWKHNTHIRPLAVYPQPDRAS